MTASLMKGSPAVLQNTAYSPAVLQNTAYSPAQTHWGQSSSLFRWDNMPVMVSSPLAMAGAKDILQKYFNIVDVGPVKWLLGICI